jgi:diguanylate cyclase (GGDEF)-like protein
VDSDHSLNHDQSAGRASWLCASDFDRERMLDMEERVRPARVKTFLILGAGLAIFLPETGFWPLLFLIPSAAFFAAANRLMPRAERPELLMFAAWLGSELTIAGAVALEGSQHIVALSWLAIPVITLSARFSMRGVVAGVATACALVIAVAFLIDAHEVIARPEIVLAPLALIVCVAVLSTPLMTSDIQHRSDAVIDQLTGMLNRNALGARTHELAQQSRVTGEPIGVIVADLDHFKRINDTCGHSVGDAALKDVAYVLRKQLRAFDLAYRLGGEEFLILVPGSDLTSALELAERLRGGVAATPVANGLPVTMSVGVSASGRHEPFDYEALFAEADAALYQAKRAGRDRVCAAESHASAPTKLGVGVAGELSAPGGAIAAA